MPDHIHIFIGYNVNQLLPDLVEKIKTSSNTWIKTNNLSKFKFDWQKGYGAFSHARSQLDTVVKYVLTQEKHHQKKSFQEEYLEMLKSNDIEFKDEYVFEFFDNISGWEESGSTAFTPCYRPRITNHQCKPPSSPAWPDPAKPPFRLPHFAPHAPGFQLQE